MDVFLLLLLILLNGVLAMSEIAIVSSRKSRLQKLADDGSPGAETALALASEPSGFLSTIQVGITTVGILSGAIGENALAWTQNQVANNPQMLELWTKYGDAIQSTGFQLSEFLRLSAISEQQGADYLNSYLTGIDSALNQSSELARQQVANTGQVEEGTRNQTHALLEQQDGLRAVSELLLGTGAVYDTLTANISLVGNATGDMSAALAESEGALDGVGSAADEASNQLRSLVNELWAPIDASYALADAVSTLGESLYENGTSFDMFSDAGQSNMDALSGVISAAVTSSAGDAGVLSANLKAIMDNLIAYGVDVANQVPGLLAMYNQVVGQAGGVKSFQQRLFGGNGASQSIGVLKPIQVANKSMTGLGKASIDTGKAMGQGFSRGATKAADAASKAGKGANGAAKEIYTLSDYVKDLGSVFSSAFEIRFGLDQSLDDVNDQFRSMQKDSTDAANAVAKAIESLDDARQDVADLNVELQELSANLSTLRSNKDILNYQLGVALDYGDTLRAQEISAELEEVEADLAKVQNDRTKKSNDLSKAQNGVTEASQELAAAQQEAIRTLLGGTESSEDQREAVLKLIQSYQGQVTALANTGMSTDQLKAKTAELKRQFEDQLRQLGYNNTEIVKYSKAFDDMAAAISRIPKNITVSASTDPAQRAIDEFMWANTGGRGASSGVNVPVGSSFNDSGLAKAARGAALQAKLAQNMAALTSVLAIPGMPGAAGYISEINRLRDVINSGNYASGGFTGRGGKYDPAGVVHKGEFVIPKQMVNQSTGLPYADAMGRIIQGYAGGGFVSAAPTVKVQSGGMVELSPTDRALLAAAGNVTLTVDGRVLASTVNKSNTRNAGRG